MKRSSQTSIHSFFKKTKTDHEPGTEQDQGEPTEIEYETSEATSTSVNINISQSSCAVTIQSTSGNVTTQTPSISSRSTASNVSAVSGTSITITLYNDISKSKDDHPVQPMKSAFPKKDMFGKMRSFQTAWYKEFPFIEYSKNNDAVYCFCCRHFPAMSGKH